MKKVYGFWVAILSVLSTASYGALDRVGDFALLDSDGAFHQLSRYAHKEALVLMSIEGSCASMGSILAQFQAVQAEWEPRGIAFVLLDSSAQTDLSVLKQLREQQQIEMPVLVDNSQLVAESLKLSSAGEMVILDPQRLTILYRGPLQTGVGETLSKGLADTMDDTMIVAATGCDLAFPARELHANSTPDYVTEVVPIVVEQCVSCHQAGGIGPFAMDSHLMLQGWSPMIREVLLTKRMPPLQVDPNIGHFTNANYITDADMQTLVHWIDAGSPRGSNAVDPLTELELPDSKSWVMGEPDYIVRAPRQEVPATGVLDYYTVPVELPFEEDKWVRAVQFIPGDASVLHHLLTYVGEPLGEDGESANPNALFNDLSFLEGYAPGKVGALVFPEDTGVLIPAGHHASMEFHFTTTGRATVDETLLGLYFHDEPPKYENITRTVSGDFTIPANAIDHKASAEHLFEEAVVVTGFRPHMHYRGKNMKYSVEAPDGTITDVLSVPNYSPNWQPTYELEEPLHLAAGTKVHVTGAFDNSRFNRANPNPNREVGFGLQSWDEMFIGYWTYHVK